MGNRPIKVDAIPINIKANTNVFFLPTRSPKWPKIIPPIGRAMKPAANVMKDNMSAVVGSTSPKKSFGNTSPAAAPYKKKSYHSILVPDKEVKATFLIFDSV